MIDRNKDLYKLVVLAISFLLMSTFAISLQFLPPIFEHIVKDISFTNSQAGMLMSVYAIPGIFLPFIIAFLANKFDKKRMIIIALLTMTIGLVAFSSSRSFVALLVYRLLTGIGATALTVLSPLLVTIFFEGKSIGIAMGIFNTAVPFGTVIAANLFGILGGVVQWKLIVLGIAGLVGLALFITFFFLSLPKNLHEENSNIEEESYRGFWSNKGLWLLALIWALANGQLLFYVTFGSQYYQTTGMTIQRAGLLTSFVMLIPIFLSPLVGIIIDRTGWKKRLLLIGSIMMAVSFALIGISSLNVTFLTVILGIGFTPIPVIVFFLLPEMIKPHHVGMGLGVLTSASNLGITFGPSTFGLFLDKTDGNFYIGFMILSLISICIILALKGLKMQISKKEVDMKL